MQTVFYKAEERGHVNHGWLNAKHSFSFASWFDENKIHFGALRVLNDDTVAPGSGFGTHPHNNMEIITLVQKGALQHKDSMGNGSVMYPNDVQVMSAGSGVTHSEFNHSKTEELKLFQIWIITEVPNVKPRYDQQAFLPEENKNQWQQIIKPHTDKEGEGIFIYQQAWFNQTILEINKTITYKSKKAGNGAYVFVIEGEILIGENLIKQRDALGTTNYELLTITANQNAKILVIDVPMIELN